MPESHPPIASTEIDSKAFEILVRQHHRRLLGYALALCHDASAAEDLVQDGFITAHRKLATFDTERDFGAWMRGIVRNKYKEWVRRRREVALDDSALETVENQHRIWDRSGQTDRYLLEALESCVEKLPQTLRAPIDLFYMDRLAGVEVADRLSTSETTVRKRLQRARTRLGVCIGESLEMAEG